MNHNNIYAPIETEICTLKRCENKKRLNSSFFPIHPKKYGVGPDAHTAYLFPPGLQEGSTFNIIIIIVKTSNDQLICFNCIMSWPTFSTRKYTVSVRFSTF